jgi:hypothetical protein
MAARMAAVRGWMKSVTAATVAAPPHDRGCMRYQRAMLPPLSLLMLQPALAWGPAAHDVIAERAEARLSPEAKLALAVLTDEPLSALANDADALRATPGGRWSTPLHFANAPLEAESYAADAACPEQRCVSAAAAHYAHYAHRLADGTPEDRREALAMVVHLVGDLHQPLHVSYAGDRGGNHHPVLFEGTRTDLHTLWDAVLPGLPGAMAAVSPPPPGGTPDAWAGESFRLTREMVYGVPLGVPVS